jgi:hypothetical membrane protein
MKALRWAGLFGIAASVVYVAATAAGSFLDPSYSQAQQHVSDLTATGAATRAALAPPYVLYNLLAFAFALALYAASSRGRPYRAGLVLLGVNAVAGVLMVFPFAEDLGGAPTTATGTGHVLLAAVSSLTIVAAAFIYGFAFRRSRGWARLSRFSIAAGFAFIVLAPLAIAATATSTLTGLAERTSISVFIVWMFVVSVRALQLSRRAVATRDGLTRTALAAS